MKLAFFATAAAAFLGATVAQAQVANNGRDGTTGRYEALTPYDGDVAVAHEDRPDMKVMGLSVPNGFRDPAAITRHPF